MNGTTIILTTALLCFAAACGKSDRQRAFDEGHQRERGAEQAQLNAANDFHQRWVMMYGNKTWEQVQQEGAKNTADAIAADRAINQRFEDQLKEAEHHFQNGKK